MLLATLFILWASEQLLLYIEKADVINAFSRACFSSYFQRLVAPPPRPVLNCLKSRMYQALLRL